MPRHAASDRPGARHARAMTEGHDACGCVHVWTQGSATNGPNSYLMPACRCASRAGLPPRPSGGAACGRVLVQRLRSSRPVLQVVGGVVKNLTQLGVDEVAHHRVQALPVDVLEDRGRRGRPDAAAGNSASSRATSIRIADSLRPCVSRSTKLKTNALTPSGPIAVPRCRSSSSELAAVEIFWYRTGVLPHRSSRCASSSSSPLLAEGTAPCSFSSSCCLAKNSTPSHMSRSTSGRPKVASSLATMTSAWSPTALTRPRAAARPVPAARLSRAPVRLASDDDPAAARGPAHRRDPRRHAGDVEGRRGRVAGARANRIERDRVNGRACRLVLSRA